MLVAVEARCAFRSPAIVINPARHMAGPALIYNTRLAQKVTRGFAHLVCRHDDDVGAEGAINRLRKAAVNAFTSTCFHSGAVSDFLSKIGGLV